MEELTMAPVFLDANVLFSAAYRADAGVARLWSLEGVALTTSKYALEEALVNLPDPDQRRRLLVLTSTMLISQTQAMEPLPDEITLPDKDEPILQAAIASGADFLVTGDQRHFGPLYGESVRGVEVIRPAAMLARWATVSET